MSTALGILSMFALVGSVASAWVGHGKVAWVVFVLAALLSASSALVGGAP